tara:strand:+ start:729 stop:914 length:186 start_codon:yes stop_codon:yes gene_type:complete
MSKPKEYSRLARQLRLDRILEDKRDKELDERIKEMSAVAIFGLVGMTLASITLLVVAIVNL